VTVTLHKKIDDCFFLFFFFVRFNHYYEDFEIKAMTNRKIYKINCTFSLLLETIYLLLDVSKINTKTRYDIHEMYIYD